MVVYVLLQWTGPQANQLEQDFSRLLANGHLASPSLYNPGYVPSSKRKTHLSYRPCGSRDPDDKSKCFCFFDWNYFSLYYQSSEILPPYGLTSVALTFFHLLSIDATSPSPRGVRPSSNLWIIVTPLLHNIKWAVIDSQDFYKSSLFSSSGDCLTWSLFGCDKRWYLTWNLQCSTRVIS